MIFLLAVLGHHRGASSFTCVHLSQHFSILVEDRDFKWVRFRCNLFACYISSSISQISQLVLLLSCSIGPGLQIFNKHPCPFSVGDSPPPLLGGQTTLLSLIIISPWFQPMKFLDHAHPISEQSFPTWTCPFQFFSWNGILVPEPTVPLSWWARASAWGITWLWRAPDLTG